MGGEVGDCGIQFMEGDILSRLEYSGYLKVVFTSRQVASSLK